MVKYLVKTLSNALDSDCGSYYEDIKPYKEIVEYYIYASSRWPNIPCQGYKGMIDMITKSNAHIGDFQSNGARSSQTMMVC